MFHWRNVINYITPLWFQYIMYDSYHNRPLRHNLWMSKLFFHPLLYMPFDDTLSSLHLRSDCENSSYYRKPIFSSLLPIKMLLTFINKDIDSFICLLHLLHLGSSQNTDIRWYFSIIVFIKTTYPMQQGLYYWWLVFLFPLW